MLGARGRGRAARTLVAGTAPRPLARPTRSGVPKLARSDEGSMHPYIVHELVRQHHADLDREASRAALAAVARSARAEHRDERRHWSPARGAALVEAFARLFRPRTPHQRAH